MYGDKGALLLPKATSVSFQLLPSLAAQTALFFFYIVTPM